MNNTLYSYLNCKPEVFTYGTEALKKVIDRECIIHTQHVEDMETAEKKDLENGRYSNQTQCRMTLSLYMPLVLAGIETIINRLQTKTAHKDKQNIETLSQLPWKNFAFAAFTTIIDSAIKTETQPRVIERIADACETEAKMQHYRTQEEGLFDRVLEQQHKRSTHKKHIENAMTVTMNRRAQGRYGDAPKPEIEFTPWTEPLRRYIGNVYLETIINTTKFFELANRRTSATNIITYISPTKLFLNMLEDNKIKLSELGGFYLPLPVPPRDWTAANDGGYWTRYTNKKRLIKNHSKGYQEEMLNLSDQLSETVFKAVNAAQHTAWRINTKVYEILQNLVHAKRPVAGLPDRENLPVPVCPKCGRAVDKDHACFIDNKELLANWKTQASQTYFENTRLKSLRLSLDYGLDAANILLGDTEFYYVYELDFRGRIYPVAQLHPQGTDWQKGLLEFARGEKLGKHGAKWLAVHTANCFGYDKACYDDRVQWVLDHEKEIIQSATAPEDTDFWCSDKVDSPFCFLAACFEWKAYVQSGRSRHFISHIPVALDGSCSGIQHYSAMLLDEIGALATNVKMLPNATRKEDIYQRVADETIKLLKHDITDPFLKPEYIEWATLCIAHNLLDRSVVKRAVMTLPYGSTFNSCSHYIRENITAALFAAGLPQDKLLTCTAFIAGRVWKAIPLVVQAARTGMDYLKALATLVAKEGLPVTWTTPTGFVVQQSYYEADSERIRLATGETITIKGGIPVWTPDKTKLVTFKKPDTKRIDKKRQISGIAPNFIHSLDASHLMFTVKAAAQQGIQDFALIHDSLATHAGKTEQFAQIIRQCFHDLYALHTPLEDITEHLSAQITTDKKKLPDFPDKGTLDLKEILNALYLFS